MEWHGQNAMDIARMALVGADLRAPICPHTSHIVAEVVEAYRNEALFRREEAFQTWASDGPQKVIRTGDLVIEAAKRKVTFKGEEVSLTAKEFDLLFQFAGHPGRVYTRLELLNLVWGYGYEGYEHTVNSHINRLRAKIEENAAEPRYILSVRGVGYKFSDAEEFEKQKKKSDRG